MGRTVREAISQPEAVASASPASSKTPLRHIAATNPGLPGGSRRAVSQASRPNNTSVTNAIGTVTRNASCPSTEGL